MGRRKGIHWTWSRQVEWLSYQSTRLMLFWLTQECMFHATAFSMPKMASKGQIPKLMLRLPKPSVLSAVEKLQGPSPNTPTTKKAESSPSMSVKMQGEKNLLTAVISNLPQTNPVSWSIDIESDQIIVGFGSFVKKFSLPQPVIVNHASNTARYYKKSHDLVVQLAVAPSQPRTRYL